jgi:branched-chain amino acid transport system substrate-binding protein
MIRRLRHSLRVVLGTLIVSSLASSPSLSAEPVKFGLVGPLTGPAANTGITVRATWELVANRINAEGGVEINGVKRPIEIIVADSQSKPNVGVSAAQKLLIRDKVDVLVGDLLHSDVALALMELAPAYPDKIIYVPLPVSSTISQKIADSPEKYGNVWKWDGDSEMYATSIADYLKYARESGLRAYKNKTFAVIHETTDYARAIITSTQAEVIKHGWKPLAEESVPIGHTDFYSQISKIKALKPDVVISIFTSASSGLAYIKQAREQKVEFDHLAVYYTNLPAFRNAVGPDGNGIIVFNSAFDGIRTERGRAFAKLMTENKINVSSDAVLGYCSANVMFDALKRAKSVKAADLGREFLKTDDDTCPNYVRVVFDEKRHSPKLGADYFFLGAGQLYNNGKNHIIFYPKRAATGVLDKPPTE